MFKQCERQELVVLWEDMQIYFPVDQLPFALRFDVLGAAALPPIFFSVRLTSDLQYTGILFKTFVTCCLKSLIIFLNC